MSSSGCFGNPALVARGWYWALPSSELKRLDRRELKLFGETLVLYRGESGKVWAIEAYCPHMGAHLKEGKVEGESLRCGFHGWRFDGGGVCAEIPCGSGKTNPSEIPRRKTFRVAEKFGMIWIHTDADAVDPLPGFPDLEGFEVLTRLDPVELRQCHPTLILGGGIDEDHFSFVHRKTTERTGPLKFEVERLKPAVIRYANSAPLPRRGLKERFFHFLSRGTLRYAVTYWYASTALAELGLPSFPLYSIFAYRPTDEGKTLGLNIYVTRKRPGPWGWLLSRLALSVTRSLLTKGGAEDRPIQNSIRLNLSPWALDNPPFRRFVEYVDEQPARRLHCSSRHEAEEVR